MIVFTILYTFLTLVKFIYSIKINYTQFMFEIYEDKPMIKISSNNYSINFNLYSIKINEIENKIIKFNNTSITMNKKTLNNLRCYNYTLKLIPSLNMSLNFYFFIDNGNINNTFNKSINISEGFLLINFTLDKILNSTYEVNMKIENNNILKKIDNNTYEIQDGIIYLIDNKNISNLNNSNIIKIKIFGSSKTNAYIGIQVKKGKLNLILCDYIWISIFLIIIILCFFFLIYKIIKLFSKSISNQKIIGEKEKCLLKK